MTRTLYWLQSGGCGGDSMALLSTESPDLLELCASLDLEPLWHPSLSAITPAAHAALLAELRSGARPLDVLVVEGAVIRGPGGTGMYDCSGGRPRKDLIAELAHRARFVVAAGTCASFGGIGADGEVEATGLQSHKGKAGGFLGEAFRSGAGLPVINLPGCPCHGEILAGTLAALLDGSPLPLTALNTPESFYGVLVHQGCVRNEYHEYRVEEADFGERGCLFFFLGCRGPLSHGTCNKLLWNRRSSKTRAGVPCFGCTRPDFPQAHPFFHTRSLGNIPLDLPEDVDRAHYMAYKGLAAAAAPIRLKRRTTRI